MIQPVSASLANTCKNVSYTSNSGENHKPVTNQGNNERYSEYIKEFNEIPKRANRFFWVAQLVGTTVGALGGLLAMQKGQLLASTKQATLIGAAAGWFLSFCVGLCKKEGVVEKQNELTQNFMKFEAENS